MATSTDRAEVIEQYDALVTRAIEIARPEVYIGEPQFCRLSIEGDMATLHYPELEVGYYDDYSTEHRIFRFPTAMLDA